MALLTVEELQAAMGVTFTDADTARAQYYIKGLSAYIQTKSGVIFGVSEDAVERFRADPYGRIKFTKVPVAEVTLVHDYATDTDMPADSFYFDGIDEYCGFYGYQVVDITYTYGQEITDDVKWAATEAVKRGMATTAQNASLKLKQVGDVIHEYSGMFPLTDEELEIFSLYGNTEWTIRTDPTPPLNHSYYGYYPWDVTRGDYIE